MAFDDLVRLDDSGVAHPVGKTASQWMRSRRGVFRLMPAPPHVIFMRFVDEDGRRDEEDGPVVRLAGEIITPGSLCDIFALVAQAGWKGELVVLDGIASRSVFFEAGDVLAAGSSAAGERIGELLFRLGALSQEQVSAVAAAATPGRRFGEIAVDLGFVTRERLFEVMRKQIEEIVFGMLLVSDGMYYFLDKYDERRIAARHHMSANNLLMHAVQRMDESKYFRERIPSDEYIPSRLAGRNDPPDELMPVWNACDGHRSVLEIGRVCGLAEFDVTRSLFQLAQSGFIHVNPPSPTGPQALVAIFNDVMRTVHRRVAAAGKDETLREHLAGFSTSIGIYDALFAGAGRADTGAVDESRVDANLKSLAGGGEPDALLAQWLYEFAAFAVFDAGSMLPKEDESALSKEVQISIGKLAPKGGAG